MRNSICILALILAGCGGIGVRKTVAPELIDSLSARTMQTLRSFDLEASYYKDRVATLRELQVLAEKDAQPDLVYAVAEMAYLLGRQTEKSSCGNAIPFYYICSGYAYHYLFGESPGSPFDPRFRQACELYNAGLAKCIRAAQQVGRLDPCRQLDIPTHDGARFSLVVSHHGFAWKPEEFGALLLCEDYRTEGLENQHRTHGLGVPLIAARASQERDEGKGLYPPGISFPVTAFFRFEGKLADLRSQRAGRLELHNSLAAQEIDVKGVKTPLETDLTTPLAYFLERANLENFAFQGFLRPDEVKQHSGVYLMEPYEPGKIPVLLVHGILSSPLTWAPLYNDLRADPRLREKYQFWFYLYPTANPYIIAAADLRDNLTNLRVRLDPKHQDKALDDMVLVGHSMGGLVSRLLTADSGNDFWSLIGKEPIDELKASDASKQELRRINYFERQPYVKRIVFLGTPHHGSKISPSLPARVLRYFVRLPRNVVYVATDLARANPEAFHCLKPENAPTSLEMLAPGSPALEVLASRPKPAGVHFHSVIGVAPLTAYVRAEKYLSGYGKTEKGDGVVPYTSAHLPEADSEVIVAAEHSEVHRHPLAVQEVRRILLEHLGQR